MSGFLWYLKRAAASLAGATFLAAEFVLFDCPRKIDFTFTLFFVGTKLLLLLAYQANCSSNYLTARQLTEKETETRYKKLYIDRDVNYPLFNFNSTNIFPVHQAKWRGGSHREKTMEQSKANSNNNAFLGAMQQVQKTKLLLTPHCIP